MKTPHKTNLSNLQSKNRASIRQYSAYKTNSHPFETGSMKNSNTMHFTETQHNETDMLKKHPKKSNSLKKTNHMFRGLEGSEGDNAEGYTR